MLELNDQGSLTGLSQEGTAKKSPTHDDATIAPWTVDIKVEGASARMLCEQARDFIVHDWHGLILMETTPPADRK